MNYTIKVKYTTSNNYYVILLRVLIGIQLNKNILYRSKLVYSITKRVNCPMENIMNNFKLGLI